MSEPAKIEAEVDAAAEPEEGGAMTFWEHLDELRKRLMRAVYAFIIGCCIAWTVHEELLVALVAPFKDSWAAQHIDGPAALHFAAPGAAFVAYVKLSMLGGAALAAPFIFYQLWAFVAPGLYAREKRFVIPFVVCSTFLFVGGGLFGWKTAFPITFDYFLSMAGTAGENGILITPTVMMNEYIDFATQLLLGFGLIFELPLLLLFLSVIGVVNYLQLIRFGRWFVLIAFTVAAFLTPPDITSQMIMGIPMVLLYGVSIGLAYVFGKKPTDEQRDEDKRLRAERKEAGRKRRETAKAK